MDPIKILEKYYDTTSDTYKILFPHLILVRDKALEIAKNIAHLHPDLKFIEEASMIHDIGIFRTNAPDIACHGDEPYIKHGVLGREILENEGFKVHALICERHVGVGLTKDEIIAQNLPLPQRDMIPQSIEEKIICIADKFFSKNPKKQGKIFTLDDIRAEVERYGEGPKNRLEEYIKLLKL
ncbi:MAG: HD domain-containing protein [Candidatus Gracilibacteria bacterium]|jgi:uncharacterized protein|nr:HD domain-containing protein [Candidatus Gracilibacteria bacterium]